MAARSDRTAHPRRHTPPPAHRRARGRLAVVTGMLGLIAALALITGLAVSRDGDNVSTRVDAPSGQGGAGIAEEHAHRPAAVDAEGIGRAGVVAVARPSVDLGQVPLDVPITHVFRLMNSGDERAALGQARIETLEGC